MIIVEDISSRKYKNIGYIIKFNTESEFNEFMDFIEPLSNTYYFEVTTIKKSKLSNNARKIHKTHHHEIWFYDQNELLLFKLKYDNIQF